MKNIYKTSFWYSFVATAYIILVGIFMRYANDIFGKENSVIGIVAVLILFSLSALVVGGLLVGKPVMFYLENKKKEAISILIANALWMLLFFIVALIVLYIW